MFSAMPSSQHKSFESFGRCAFDISLPNFLIYLSAVSFDVGGELGGCEGVLDVSDDTLHASSEGVALEEDNQWCFRWW